MDSSLNSILSGEPTEPTPEPQQPAQAEVQQPEQVETEQQGTGEQEAGSPPEPQKDDNLEKARKGLEAAAAAERKKRQDAEARAEAAERRAQAMEMQWRHQQPKPQTEAQPDTDPKPLRSHFETEDEWLDARDAWRDRQREAQAAMDKARKQAEDTYTKTEGIYAKAQVIEGFNRAAFDALPLTKPIVEALIESEKAPELMAYMAANPAEVLAISQMQSSARQIAAMARIEDKLSAAPAQEDEKPPAKEKPALPNTLTQTRNAKGQFEPAYSGPTPLNAILK